MGREERMGLVWKERERGRKGAKARSSNDRPPDYIVAQINRPFADSLESSCSTEEESFHFRGLRSSQASDGMWPGCLPTPFPHSSISKSMNGGTGRLLV